MTVRDSLAELCVSFFVPNNLQYVRGKFELHPDYNHNGDGREYAEALVVRANKALNNFGAAMQAQGIDCNKGADVEFV